MKQAIHMLLVMIIVTGCSQHVALTSYQAQWEVAQSLGTEMAMFESIPVVLSSQ